MSWTVHIVPLGSEERVLKSLRESNHPVNKVYLVGYKETISTAEQIGKALGILIEVEIIEVESEIYSAVFGMAEAVGRELKKGNRVVVTLTDCPTNLAIACLITALVSGSRLYTSNRNEKENLELKIPPARDIGTDRLRILRKIEEEGGEVDSVTTLIELLEGKLKNENDYLKERAKVNYHIRILEEEGFVKSIKVGNGLKVKLTEIGRAYAIMAV